jgi:hypothetical protein
MDFHSFAVYKSQHKFLLTVVDTLSKYAFVRLLKDKFCKSDTAAFEDILNEEDRCPEWLCTDSGKEFLGREFQAMCKRREIHFYTAPSDVKACLVERYNRSLKTKMWRYFTANATFKYIDRLQDFVKSYNTTEHSTIKMRPVDVTQQTQVKAWENMYGEKWPGHLTRVPKYKFKVGESVKISRWKRLFEKGYNPNWTTEEFTVIKRLNRKPPVYKIMDDKGEIIDSVFCAPELLRVYND